MSRQPRDKLGRFASSGSTMGKGLGQSSGFAKKTGLSSNDAGASRSGYTSAQAKIVRKQMAEHEKTWPDVRKHPPGSKQRHEYFRKEDSIMHQFDSHSSGTGKSKSRANESFEKTAARNKSNAQKLASRNSHTQALFAKGIDVSNRSGMSKTQFAKLKAKYKFR